MSAAWPIPAAEMERMEAFRALAELVGFPRITGPEADGAEGLAQVPQQRPGPVAVLDAGRGDQNGQQQPDGVDGDVPLAAVILSPQLPVRDVHDLG